MCGNWSSGSAQFSYGYSTAGTSNWTNFTGSAVTCGSLQAHIYCFERGVASALLALSPPVNSKLAFLTDDTFSPGLSDQASLSDADSFCQDETAYSPALQSRTFKAFLGTNSGATVNHAYGRFTGGPWYRQDGVLVGALSDLQTGFVAPLSEFGSTGSAIASTAALGSEDTWTGEYLTTSSNCSNWTSTSGFGTVGLSSLGDVDGIAVSSGTGDCSTDKHIYCLEVP